MGAVIDIPIHHWQPSRLLIGLLGVIALHAAANVANEWFDHLSGIDALADKLPGNLVTTPGVLLFDDCTLPQIRRFTFILLIIAELCGVVLLISNRSLFMGLIFIVGGLLAFFYSAPPLALAYRGRGLGELAALLSFGPLPALVAYQTQHHEISWLPILLVSPLSFLAAALLIEHHYLHWEADKIIGKQTPVVAFGPIRAWKLLGGLLVATYLSLIGNVLGGTLAPWTLLLLLSAYPVMISWHRIHKPVVPDQYMILIEFTSQTHLLFAIVIITTLLMPS